MTTEPLEYDDKVVIVLQNYYTTELYNTLSKTISDLRLENGRFGLEINSSQYERFIEVDITNLYNAYRVIIDSNWLKEYKNRETKIAIRNFLTKHNFIFYRKTSSLMMYKQNDSVDVTITKELQKNGDVFVDVLAVLI